LGHAAQHLEEHPYFTAWIADPQGDTVNLRLENDNLSRFETPIALELGEFVRTYYGDASGAIRMDNSTDWGILHTRPSWHYVNPLVWRQPRITFENQNTWTPGWSKYVDLFNEVDDEYEQY